ELLDERAAALDHHDPPYRQLTPRTEAAALGTPGLVAAPEVAAQRKQHVAAQAPPVEPRGHVVGGGSLCAEPELLHLHPFDARIEAGQRARQRRLAGARRAVHADQQRQPSARMRVQARDQPAQLLYSHVSRSSSVAASRRRPASKRAAKPATQRRPPGTGLQRLRSSPVAASRSTAGPSRYR